MIDDNKSKFGTLLEIRTPFPLETNGHPISIQAGRTVLTFTLKRRWNFLIPTCFRHPTSDISVVLQNPQQYPRQPVCRPQVPLGFSRASSSVQRQPTVERSRSSSGIASNILDPNVDNHRSRAEQPNSQVSHSQRQSPSEHAACSQSDCVHVAASFDRGTGSVSVPSATTLRSPRNNRTATQTDDGARRSLSAPVLIHRLPTQRFFSTPHVITPPSNSTTPASHAPCTSSVINCVTPNSLPACELGHAR